ncbi:unnamed protein product, partial [Sphacelaria rigidula]
ANTTLGISCINSCRLPYFTAYMANRLRERVYDINAVFTWPELPHRLTYRRSIYVVHDTKSTVRRNSRYCATSPHPTVSILFRRRRRNVFPLLRQRKGQTLA